MKITEVMLYGQNALNKGQNNQGIKKKLERAAEALNSLAKDVHEQHRILSKEIVKVGNMVKRSPR